MPNTVSEPKLKDWVNANEVGSRFPQSRQLCPNCQNPCQQDEWPPNYGGGHGVLGEYYESSGTQKYVCVPCRIAFGVHSKRTSKYVQGRQETTEEHTVIGTFPLVEKDGYLLTPYDVSQENYKSEHGHYESVSYG